jgi:hypothetical protein
MNILIHLYLINEVGLIYRMQQMGAKINKYNIKVKGMIKMINLKTHVQIYKMILNIKVKL